MDDKKKILLIDDEVDLLETIQYQFESKGFEVITAQDGLEGLERLKTDSPDLIILDMNMPRMNGVEFYQNICGESGKPSHPVLVLTARANMEQLFRELDIDGFMSKPFDIDQLVKEADTIIKKRSRGGQEGSSEIKRGPKTVFVVENDTEAFSKISVTFLDAGYKVNSAKSGTSAIEKMMADPPDLALVNLSLTDLSGDLVIRRLKGMPKTMDIECILYTRRTGEHDKAVIEKLADKKGVDECVEYVNPEELLKAADKLFEI